MHHFFMVHFHCLHLGHLILLEMFCSSFYFEISANAVKTIGLRARCTLVSHCCCGRWAACVDIRGQSLP